MGWVVRRPCPEDGRTQRVWLTPEGQQQLTALKQALTRINHQLHVGFTDEELHTVGRWLEYVRQIDSRHRP